jgi:hypothetical protein
MGGPGSGRGKGENAASQRERLANLSHEEQEQHRATNAFIIPIENKQGPMPSPLNNTYTSNVVYRNVLI